MQVQTKIIQMNNLIIHYILTFPLQPIEIYKDTLLNQREAINASTPNLDFNGGIKSIV